MAILSRDEYFARLHDRLGSDTSDESIAFLEDMTDTYNDMESRSHGDGIDWQKKYQELDESWKKRYRHRFFSGGDTAVPMQTNDNSPETEYDAESITVDDLFTEKKGV